MQKSRFSKTEAHINLRAGFSLRKNMLYVSIINQIVPIIFFSAFAFSDLKSSLNPATRFPEASSPQTHTSTSSSDDGR